MADQPAEDRYQYDEPIPAPVGVDLYTGDEFGEWYDPSKTVEIDSEPELKRVLESIIRTLSGIDSVSDREIELIEISLEVASTSMKIDGYDDCKKVEEWETHEEIDDLEEYRIYLRALARRMNEASDHPPGSFHAATGDVLGIANNVGRDYTLKEAKSRMNQIGVSEELRDP